MKYTQTFESFLNGSTEEVNEKVNASGYIKAGKLGYNDQFLGRRSLSYTLSTDLGLNPKHEFGGGDWLGFDHVSLYASGKKGGTILADALSGNYTYDELKAAAAEFLGLSESKLNEKFSKKDAKQLIKDLKSDGYDASGSENWIQVDGVDSPNPDYDGTVSMAWDPSEEEAYSDDETYEEPIKTAEDFMDLVNYPEDTFGKWD